MPMHLGKQLFLEEAVKIINYYMCLSLSVGLFNIL